MISELWQYWRTPCPTYARRMGFLSESIGIYSRYRRCYKSWEDHLMRCKNFISDEMVTCSTKKVAVIMGSGWLLDIPIERLSADFEKVYLLDIVHPLGARERCRKLKNVFFIADDVTGVNRGIYDYSRNSKSSSFENKLKSLFNPKDSSVPEYGEKLDSLGCDFLVSVNLLSQVAYLPIEFLKQMNYQLNLNISEIDLQHFRQNLQKQHLGLMVHASKACLITDVESTTHDGNGEVKESEQLVPNIVLPEHVSDWKWCLAPVGEVDSNTGKTRTVAAFHFGK